MHEEDGKHDVRLEAKITGGGDWGLALHGRLCPEERGREASTKGESRVVVQPKGERPPPQNNNQGDRQRGDKKGKP